MNKGTGAGGANTNYYGKKFEEKTNNEQRLLESGYIKASFTNKPNKAYDYYLIKTYETKTIVFVLQNGLKLYMKNKYHYHPSLKICEADLREIEDKFNGIEEKSR